MGSVTERVLGTTRLPLLIVRPQNMKTKQEKARDNEGSQRVEGKGMTGETQTWVGLF